MKSRFALLAPLFLVACSSTPKVTTPDWIRLPTRTVDGGYIVFVGTGEDPAPEKSTFKAEAQALQDIANECSFAPKGTRVEDHFQEPSGHTNLSYAKVSVSIIDCDAAKASNDPESIKKLASQPLADQLKKYQDLVYSPGEPEETEKGSGGGNPMLAYTGGPPADPDGYFIYRQRVAYVKQEVILAPATVYVVNAPQTVAVTQQLSTSTAHLRTYEQTNPEVKSWHRSWSQVERNPTSQLPGSFPHYKGQAPHPLRASNKQVHSSNVNKEVPAPAPAPKKRGRRRRSQP
jgi:hypothetical protein